MGSVRSMAAGILPEHEVGDLKLVWAEEDDQRMVPVIRRKMEQGIRFYEVEPDTGERIQLRDVADLRGRELFVGDEEFEQLWREGRVGFFARVQSALSQVRLIRRVTDPQEAARTHTWAMRQMRGG